LRDIRGVKWLGVTVINKRELDRRYTIFKGVLRGLAGLG